MPLEMWKVMWKISLHGYPSSTMVGPLALCSSKLTIKGCWLAGGGGGGDEELAFKLGMVVMYAIPGTVVRRLRQED